MIFLTRRRRFGKEMFLAKSRFGKEILISLPDSWFRGPFGDGVGINMRDCFFAYFLDEICVSRKRDKDFHHKIAFHVSKTMGFELVQN